MGDLYNNLHKLYPVQKTLRFELIPVGDTKDNIERDGILTEDEHRAETYKKVKKYMDEYHKLFIERALSNIKLKNLKEYQSLYNTDKKDEKQREELKKIESLLRKEIVENLKKNKDEYNGLFSKDMIETYLKEFYRGEKEILEEIEEFNGFTTYFTGYNKNRENMYSDEEKSTAISYRLINENLPTFLSNMKTYKKVAEKIPQAIKQIYKDLEEYIQVENLDEMFTLDYFNDVLTQKGITLYNLIIAGKNTEGTNIKGLNGYINEYNQTHSDKILKLKELYKQILSDKVSISFVIDKIEDDNELVNAIKAYNEELNKILESKNNFIKNLQDIRRYNIDKIYLNNDLSITNISNEIFNDWSYIKQALNNNYDKNYKGKAKKGTEKYEEQRKEYFKKMKNISIGYIEQALEEYDSNNKGKVEEYFASYIEKEEIIEKIKGTYKKYESILCQNYNKNSRELIKDDTKIEEIKNFLDSIKGLQEFVKILIPKDKTLEIDEAFYNQVSTDYDMISEIIPLYNKTRNYLTQKPYSNEKIKLNFETPTFLDGWDVNKEKQNLGVILTKGGNYYLGIMTKNNKKIFDEEYQSNDGESNYKKIEYKLLPGPNKMLPKVFFSKSRIEEFSPSSDLIKKYKEGIFKKGENFDLSFCHELIDFYKASIMKHEDWKEFNFNFKDTKEYKEISEFYKEVEEQGYKIGFANFSEEYIESKIKDGELYLFQIYNKDFSKYSSGKPNLHTMYWKALFDEKNLNNVVYKLNGNAEVFYRKSSLKLSETAIHKANEPIKNKNEYTIRNKPTSEFKYDLIKNKRYTVDKFQLNVPITMNFKNGGISNINEIVNKYLKYNDDIHIIGIDRGERNLLYISVINSKGEIVYQKSLNEIVNEVQKDDNVEIYKTDYHNLLDKRETEHMNARKSWKTIGNIKELKEGYMSQVIYELVKLLQKYKNSIIVIEDLNKGFKNSRIKVEKQVYQKFEQMLINKLNYLVIKDKDKTDEGGVLNAYQLTNKFESFKKLGKQTGVLFYIPAWCTSKIDPTTGFVNLFYVKNESLEKAKDFVDKFNDIRYNSEEGYFEFDIDYLNFSDRLKEAKNEWTICTYSNRIRTFRNVKNNSQWSNEEVDLTKEMKNLFERYGIDINNIKGSILEKADAKFFNAVKEKDGFYGFTNLFKLTVQMRNSVTGEMEDYLISPVKNKQGRFFDSREGNEKLPKDADGNGAYNIARKGLMLIEQIRQIEDDKLRSVRYNITNKEWLQFVQNVEED